MKGLTESPRCQSIRGFLQRDRDFTTEDEFQEAVKETFIEWLSQDENRSWLLIVDNVDDPENFSFSRLLPWATPWGSVVVTTRRADLAISWKSIEIDAMSPSESMHLFWKSSKLQVDLENENS